MSRHATPEIHLVQARLRQAGLRLRWQALIDAGLIGGAAGAAAFALAAIERRVIRVGILPSADWPTDLAMAGAFAVIVALAYMLLRLPRLPDVVGLARQADRLFALDERLSTVVGLSDAGPDGAVLRRALLNDAVTHLPRVVPARLAPFQPSAAGLVFPVLAALGLAVVMLNPLPQTFPVAARAADAPLDEANRTAAAADVTRVANLMREQAELRDDPYMAAVARTLGSLAERLATDPSLTRAEAIAALTALSTQARAAGREWRGEAGTRLPEMVAALAEVLAESPMPPDPTATGAIPDAMAAGLNGQPAAPGAPQPDQPAGTARDGFEAMMDEFAQSQGRPAAAGAQGGVPRPVVTGPYLVSGAHNDEAATQRGAGSGEQEQLMGPSANARAGDSVLAGEGTDALTQSAAEPVTVTFETSGSFVLEANVTGEGRQMLRDLPPEVVLTPVAAFDLAEARAIWQAIPAAAAWRDRIGPGERAAVQGYFLARAAEVAR